MKNKIDLSIITPVHNKVTLLRGYFASLKEQDIWERMEVICVENGSTDKSWEELNKIYNKLSKKDKERVKIIQIDKANACTARNEGAKLASGKYWSFLPADAFLMPGSARTWVESLDEATDYGFVYGGYRFTPPNSSVYMSEKYDHDMLLQYNYVDGSFPFRKELYPWFNKGGWDPAIKSLQDWDFWIAIILGEDKKGSGVKGLYRPEIFFETLPPQPGGLSDDSHKNWIERVKTIKDKWGIHEGEIVVTAPGAPFHAKNIAKILGQEFRHAPQYKPHNFKMIYELGFYPQLAQQCSAVFSTINGNFSTAKKVIHWVGSDIWGLLNSSILQVQKLRDQFLLNNFIHLVEFEQTQNELRMLGIDAKIVPLPPAKLYEVMPLPKKFTIAVYMPEQNKDFYYPTLMKEVAHKLPDIDFLFFGDRFDLSQDKNIQNVGYIEDMEKLIKECSAIVRMTQHDGLPLSLAEFVMAGRNALFNIKMPHMVFANTNNADLLAVRIRDLQKLPLNEEGSKYYRELMDHDKYRKTIMDILHSDVDGYNPKAYWEARADIWQSEAPYDFLPHKEEVTEMLNKIKFNSVLDIGCGNGRWSQYFNGKEYKGIDISDNLIDSAKRFFPDSKFESARVEDLPKDKKYDLVFSYTCMQHIKEKDMQRAADNLKRISRYILLVESQNFQSADYCIDHDYSKYFNVIETISAKTSPADNPNDTLKIMLVDNGDSDAN